MPHWQTCYRNSTRAISTWRLPGFSAEELEKLMTWTAPNPGLTDENAVPEPPKEPVTKAGDLWVLGPHRLLCGDCTVPGNVARLLADVRPNLMVTDPPYGVNYDPKWRNGHGGFSDAPTKQNGIVTNDDRHDWREAMALFQGNIAYVWHSGVYSPQVADSLTAVGLVIRSQIVWVKQQLVMGRGHYHWQHEPCFYAVRQGATGNWTGDRKQSTVWQIQNLNPTGNRKEGLTGHGTQKPVECMRRPILNHTSSGQFVYDPFLGSGTTIIAAESTGRICYGIEIDPVYVDVAVTRWQDFTGKKAELA